MSDRHAPPDQLPPLRTIKTGLRRTTEALARELAQPEGDTPDWTELEWRLAAAAAVAHGVAGLQHAYSLWKNPHWSDFLASQHEHVAQRHARIDDLLRQIDARAKELNISLVAMKGAALHALGLYEPGERPMADIDLLVSDDDREQAHAMLQSMHYEAIFTSWKHRVYKPAGSTDVPSFGEHRDTPVNIELHTRIQERLPVATVDITHWVYPRHPVPGLNPYPSLGALMSHLLLHAAGNICNRSMRLIHLHDISLLASRMMRSEWLVLWGEGTREPAWWAIPPLLLVSRYYTGAVPPSLLYELEQECHATLRYASRRLSLTQVSCSELWLHAWSGIEWARSSREIGQYVLSRVRPSPEARQQRADMLKTQLWLQNSRWVSSGQFRRAIAWLTKPVPRTDTMYVVRAALGQAAMAEAQLPEPSATSCR
ncbi:nucleotidyltransferase family protein [Dyella telluris]|uniref:Nucleotidyltransferase family protein n=1 Tax=Dyella telluris TaxID=2763498 RepID=A0A7G8Q3E0_9GAMM|nr:nucleotidyltransferase family protein [Dyella telluris]QNK01298.1 nucleotidyltransferase family protein [Dyella telluris]